MARILVLAQSGFGKTTSWAGREKLGIKGLDPKETYVIQCVGRGVPNPNYKLCPSAKVEDIAKGNRINVESLTGLDRFKRVAELLELLKDSPYRNVVIDDFNYLMQDYFMANAMKGGWQTPKEIGYGIGLIFDAFKGFPENKNIYVCAHYEKSNDNDGQVTYKMKTTGKMIDEYCTPQGKFDIMLYGKQSYDESKHQAIKVFVKDFDGTFPAKDSIGALDNLPDEFPNDLALVDEELKKFYGNE